MKLKDNQKQSNNKVIYYSIFLVFGLMFCLAYYFVLNGSGGILPEFYDFDEHWKASAYLIRGIEPFLSVDKAVIPEIGQMMDNFISVPWSYLLTTIYSPGFLPLEIARVYGMIIFIVLVILDILVINKIFNKYFECNIFITIGVFLLAYPKVIAVWMQGNNAIMVSSFIIYGIYFLLEDKEYIAGIFLGFAMVKPQTAFLFFIPLLFMKKYRTVIVSIAIVLSAWIVTAFMLNENVFSMFFASFERGVNQEGDERYSGIFSVLSLFNIGRDISMKISMALGLLLQIIMSIYLSFKSKLYGKRFCLYLAFVTTSTLSPLWMYSSVGDFIVQFIMISFMMMYFDRKDNLENGRIKLINVIINTLIMLFVFRFIDNGIGVILKLLLPDLYVTMSLIFTFIIDIIFIIIGLWICINIEKLYKIIPIKEPEK